MNAYTMPLPFPWIEGGNSENRRGIDTDMGNNWITKLIFLWYFILNILIFFDVGALVSRPWDYSDSQRFDKNNYYGILISLSYIGNILLSLLSWHSLHRLYKKSILLIALFGLCCSLIPFTQGSWFALPLHIISQLILSLSKPIITINSIEWCKTFADESNRLDTIMALQFTSIIGIWFGFVWDWFIKNLAYYTEIIRCSMVFLILIFIPTGLIENKTLTLTDDFLRRSWTNQYDEIKANKFLFVLLLIWLSVNMFIIGTMFTWLYPYLNIIIKVNDLSVWLIACLAILLVAPLIGVIIGGIIVNSIKRFKILYFIEFIFIVLLIVLVNVFILMKKYEYNPNNFSSILRWVSLLSIWFFLIILTLPFIYYVQSSIFILRESRGIINSVTIFTSNFFGLFLSAFLSSFIRIDYSFLYILSIELHIYFVFFVIFGLFSVVLFHKQPSNELTTKLYEYQFLLIWSTIFSKFVWFIWDDFKGESIVEKFDNKTNLKNQLEENLKITNKGINDALNGSLFESESQKESYILAEQTDDGIDSQEFIINNAKKQNEMDENRDRKMTFKMKKDSDNRDNPVDIPGKESWNNFGFSFNPEVMIPNHDQNDFF